MGYLADNIKRMLELKDERIKVLELKVRDFRAEVEALKRIIEAARAVEAQWTRACTYDTPEIIALRETLKAIENPVEVAATEGRGCQLHGNENCGSSHCSAFETSKPETGNPWTPNKDYPGKPVK